MNKIMRVSAVGLTIVVVVMALSVLSTSAQDGPVVPQVQPTPDPTRITSEMIDALRAQSRVYEQQAAAAQAEAQAATSAAQAALSAIQNQIIRAQAVQAQAAAANAAAEAARASADRVDVAAARQAANDATVLSGQAQRDALAALRDYTQIAGDAQHAQQLAESATQKYESAVTGFGAFRLVMSAKINGMERTIIERDQQIAALTPQLSVVQSQSLEANSANVKLQVALISATVVMSAMVLALVYVVHKWKPVIIERLPVQAEHEPVIDQDGVLVGAVDDRRLVEMLQDVAEG